jgi:tRNA(Ile)-lysidine synthase
VTPRDGDLVVVGCSGGADSLALLALACTKFRVVAVYVDHGLRAGTEHDANVVREAANRFGASFRIVRISLDGRANLEARARDARYAALESVRAETSAVAVLVAHTRDDQAETVLLNLLRGSAITGLAGMSAHNGSVWRPLLDMRRAQTHELCRALNLAPVHDPMNDDVHHRRVWLRREIIPMLERGANRDLVEVLARQADLMRADDALLDELAATHSINDLADIPDALARRVVRAWLGAPYPSAATIDRVLEVARGRRAATELPGGDRVERAGGRLARVPGDPSPPDAAPLALPGRTQFGPVAIDAWIEHGPPTAWPDGRRVAVCDADLVPAAAVVRSPRTGERFVPLGNTGTKLLHDALAEAGVPATLRRASPVVAARSSDGASTGEPIWVVGYRIDHRVRVTARTRRFLWLSAEPVN